MKKPQKICERVFLVSGPEMTGGKDCCVYLLDGGAELALVDSGLDFSGEMIIENIRKLGLKPSLLKYVTQLSHLKNVLKPGFQHPATQKTGS